MALGGCLKAPPVNYGITADTGGHIAYVLDAACAQSQLAEVDHVQLVTRLFDDPQLGSEHSAPSTVLGSKLGISRIATDDRRYLEKEALDAELPRFTDAFCAYLTALPRLPDIIHAHFADAASIAAEVRRRLGVPFIYTPHALGIDKRSSGTGSTALDRRIASERAAIEQADAIVLSSNDEAIRQVAAYGVPDALDRTLCAPPGAPSAPARATGPTIVDRLGEYLVDPAKPIILLVARPVRKKNIAALLRAYAGCPALARATNLVILAGQHGTLLSPEEREVIQELRALAALPTLAGRVALPATHDAADVAALYCRAARGGVFVNPALHEPFGLTLLEAAKAGVPVVSTCFGGPGEIIARVGHGLLVDPHDEAAIASACLRIVTDPALHSRLAAAAGAGAGFYSWPRYAAATVARYETLMPAPALLACDIDGTLTGCWDGAQRFGAWAARRDIPFLIATGRRFDQARAIVRHWDLPDPDGYITDVGSTMMLRTTGGRWKQCADHAATLDDGWDRDAVFHLLAKLPVASQPADCQSRHKLSYFGTDADAAAVRRVLAEASLSARVVHSHGTLIDILPLMGGKAAAIADYAARFTVPLAACIAAGDSGNDADMLMRCGRAIIVANADHDLAGLGPRRGLYRSKRSHAAGVMEGLAAHGLIRDRARAA